MVKDYSKSKIYRIVSDQTNEVYIGSTIQTLEARYSKHKHDLKRDRYCASVELLKHGDARIELIRDFPCNSERELAKEETNHMLACPNPVVNHNRASRTKAEWREDNRDQLIEYNKQRYEANREQILEQKKQKYDCPCGSTIRKSSKLTHEKSKKHQDYINRENSEEE